MAGSRNGMTEQQEERLRSVTRAWLAAADELSRAADGDDTAAVMELADRATIARLVFQQTLVDLGWTPPSFGHREGG